MNQDFVVMLHSSHTNKAWLIKILKKPCLCPEGLKVWPIVYIHNVVKMSKQVVDMQFQGGWFGCWAGFSGPVSVCFPSWFWNQNFFVYLCCVRGKYNPFDSLVAFEPLTTQPLRTVCLVWVLKALSFVLLFLPAWSRGDAGIKLLALLTLVLLFLAVFYHSSHVF